jgi:hypothetical protein
MPASGGSKKLEWFTAMRSGPDSTIRSGWMTRMEKIMRARSFAKL